MMGWGVRPDTQCLGGVAIGDWSLGSARVLVVQQVLDHNLHRACGYQVGMRRRRSTSVMRSIGFLRLSSDMTPIDAK